MELQFSHITIPISFLYHLTLIYRLLVLWVYKLNLLITVERVVQFFSICAFVLLTFRHFSYTLRCWFRGQRGHIELSVSFSFLFLLHQATVLPDHSSLQQFTEALFEKLISVLFLPYFLAYLRLGCF